MKITLLFSLFFFVEISFGIPRESKEVSATCRVYSRTDYNGYSIEFRDYIEDLYVYDFDDTLQSAKIDGIWLFYEDPKYNERDFRRRSFYAWGKNYGINTFGSLNRAISSLRYSGVPENMKQSTINFYDGAGFMGREEYYYRDSSYMNSDNFGKSIIVTGCEPWTLYEDRHYRGDHICLYPSSSQRCEPGFYVEPKDFGNFINKVSSLRRGCHTKKIFKGLSVPANSTGMFQAKLE